MSDMQDDSNTNSATNTDSVKTATVDPSLDKNSKEERPDENLESTQSKQDEDDSLVLTHIRSKVSLQDMFKDFKKQRREHFKNKQYLRDKKSKERGTKEFQDLLRNKFVETAKKYLGVPYAKKYTIS